MKPSEFAELVGVSVKTLHRWDKTGKLTAKRTLSNHRYYTEEDLEGKVLSPQPELVEDMLAIIHCFSCRIYGSRSYAKQKTKAFREILDTPPEKMLTLRKQIAL